MASGPPRASEPAPPLLRGEGIELRPFAEEDVPELVGILAEEDVLFWWGSHDEERLRRDFADPEVTAWTLVAGGSVCGALMATEESEPDYRHVELDLFLRGSCQGRGLGAEVLRAALRHLFEERGHHRAVIVPAAANQRAISCYRKVGFRPVGIMRRAERGRDGNWRDCLAMDLLAGELR